MEPPCRFRVEGTGAVESVPFALNGFGTTRFSLTPTSEWASIRIQVDSGLVAAVAHQDYGPAGAAQRGPATVGDELVVPILQATGSGQETRLAFGSTGEAARIELTLRGRDGQELRGGTATIRLPEGGSSTFTLAELFSGGSNRRAGWQLDPLVLSVGRAGCGQSGFRRGIGVQPAGSPARQGERRLIRY